MDIGDILISLIIFVFLIFLYKIMAQNWEWKFSERIRNGYFELERNSRKKDYIQQINFRHDKEKIIFQDTVILIIVFSVIIIFVTQSIYFAAVASGSMNPTFDKFDIILMQNIDRKYEAGDIIMFNRPDTSLPVTHRISSIDLDGNIKTAGDASGADWWQLKNDVIKGKAIIVGGKPIIIKNFGRYFIAEDRNQRFGPFDYSSYFLFFEVIKLYGYVIASICILVYIFLEIKKFKKYKNRMN